MELKIKQLKKPNIKLIIGVAGAVILTAVFSVVMMKNTDTGGDYTPNIDGGAYPSNFYHYTGFNEKPDIFMKLSWKNTTLKLGSDSDKIKLMTRIFPITLEDKRVEYKSSNENVAKVSEDGTVTAVEAGTAQITVTLLCTGQSENAELTVVRPVTGVILKDSSITMNISDALKRIEAEVYPENATNKNLKWESKNPKIATVDENGTLKPLAIGLTEIVVTTEDGAFTAKGFVNVINKVINPESVVIQNNGGAKLEVGESLNMIATVAPSNSKNKTVTWESSDTGIVSVSKTGKLKALKEGAASITVKTSNGKSDTMELTVVKSSVESALNLYGKTTSNEGIPTDILGSTYIKTNHVTNGGTTYTSYDVTLTALVDKQMGLYPPPKIWRGGGLVSATRDETTEYMNPESYYTGAYKYQFLDLSSSNGVSAEELNRFLEGKGILEGQGQAFVEAAAENNVSEVYLVAHACHETGNGSTQLATGVNVNGTTVYNMFGIAAYDDSALYSGSQKAYNEGWTTPAAAIKGGAAWISKWYVNASDAQQNTLYKMLWNPEKPGEHQYATDIGWAVKQAVNIEKIFASFPNAVLSYDIPVFEGQTAITLE